MSAERRDGNINREEQPLVEFPALVKTVIIFLSICIAAALLFFPWYIPLGAFIIIVATLAVFMNPYVGILLFLMGALIHPAQIIGESVAELHLARNLAFLMLFAWMFHILIYRDFKMKKSAQNWIAMGFCITLLCSSFKYPSFSFSQFVELSKLFVLYFMVINLVRTPRHILIIFWFIVFLSLIAGIVGVYQYTHGIGMYSSEDGVLRITGTSLDPNDYAMHIVMVLPLILSFFLVSRNIFVRVLLVFTSILLLANIVFTFSRGGFIGLGIVAFASFVILVAQKRIKPVGIVIILIIMVMISTAIPSKYWQRMLTSFNPSEASASARLESWKAGIGMMVDHPVVGIGLGAFAYEYALRANIQTYEFKVKIPRFAHNSYIQVGAEAGVIALALFLLLIIFSFRDIFIAQKVFREKNEDNLSNLSQFLGVSMLGYAACGMFLTQAYITMFWIIVPVIVAMRSIALEHGQG
ncbi:MAG: O-antigen ligase family protein [Syntrophorhabdaceae bacterium]|nr:O-antigen ligase family protein [Syntrophorhabdaceae bacterium]